MKDAFGEEVKEGSMVLYSTGGSYGTVYHSGEVVRLLPAKETVPDKVEIKIVKSSNKQVKFTKNPLVYVSNVVLIL